MGEAMCDPHGQRERPSKHSPSQDSRLVGKALAFCSEENVNNQGACLVPPINCQHTRDTPDAGGQGSTHPPHLLNAC